MCSVEFKMRSLMLRNADWSLRRPAPANQQSQHRIILRYPLSYNTGFPHLGMESSPPKPPGSVVNPPSAIVRSCLECRRRKIKCDRSVPCSYCVKVKIQCSYPPPRDVSQKSVDHPTGEDLVTRIARVEQTLESLEGSLSHICLLLQTQASQVSSTPDGRSCEYEVYQHQQRHENGKHDMSPSHSLFKPPSDPALESLRPRPVLIISLWQKYLENVHPIINILHFPTTQKQIMGITRGREVLSPSTECLLFAIYYAAAATMTAEDCQNEFNENKTDMLKG